LPVTLPTPTRVGYDFAGWYDNSACTGTAITTIPVGTTGNKEFWAKWTTKTYTITYNNVSGISNPNPTSYTIETPTITLVDLSREGYTFDGWYDNANFRGSKVTTIPLGSTGNKEFWAKWTVKTYTITYNNVNGATNTNPTSYTIETPTITLVDLSREGYTFDGWYDNANFRGSKVTTIPLGSTGNKEFWGKWTAKTYTITYNNVSGVPNSNPTSYTIETPTITLVDLSREGYTFDGWYDNANFRGSKVTTIPLGSTGNKEFWGKWTAKTYTITYNNVSGVPNSNPTSYTIETPTITLVDLSREGYTFDGWYDNANFSGSKVTTIPLGSTGNKEFWGKWTPKTYTITYNNISGVTSNPNPTSYTIETPTITLVDLSCEGYTFDGWYDNANFSGSKVTTIPLGSTGNKEFWGKWTPKTYTITYNNISGVTNNPNPTSYTIETPTITLVDLSREGYTFDGWYDNANFSGSKVTTIPLGSTGNKEYWAKWTVKTYTITYNNVSGATNPNPTSYTIETPTITLIDLSREGYTFDGWYDNANFSGSKVTTIPLGSTGNKEFWAKWTPITYTITYNNVSGASNPNPTSYTIETPTITLIDLSREGYNFNGWYDNADFTGSEVTTIPLGSTGNKTFYAKWTPKNYTITYHNVYGVTNTNPTSYTIETPTITLADLARDGYDFDGWYDNADFTGSEVTTIPLGNTGNKEFWAKWTAKTYTITYNNVSGASNSNPTSYTIETPTITLVDLSREGYTFDGWYDNANFSGNAVTIISQGSTGNKEFWAKWTAITYTIIYHTGEASSLPDESYTIESPEITLPTPTWTGHNFLGWFADANFTGNAITIIPTGSTGDKEYWAKWDTIRFTITITKGANGTVVPAGNSSGEVTVDYGNTVSFSFAPDNGYQVDVVTVDGNTITPTPSGYTFDNVTANHTLSVTFKELPPNTYNLTLQAEPLDLGSVFGAGTYTAGSDANISAKANANAEFVNWTLDGQEYSKNPETSVTMDANKTLIAHFKLKPKPKYQISVTVDPANAGTVTGSGEYEENRVCTLEQTPSDKYKFLGYFLDGNLLSNNARYSFSVTRDMHIIARYEKITEYYTVKVTANAGGTAKASPTTVEAGKTSTLEAVPDANHKFVKWTTSSGEFISSDNPLVITVIKDTTFVAHFEKEEILNSIVITRDLEENVSVSVGGTLILEVNVKDDLDYDLSYQWYKDNEKLANATSRIYTKDKVTVADAGNYYCKISNSAGHEKNSKTAKVSVISGLQEQQNLLEVYFDGDRVLINNPENLEIKNIQLIDLTGVNRLTTNNAESVFSLPTLLPNGVYMLVIEHSLGYDVYKIIKAK
jgi:uncharacterized repeat protein (TIGR02543 family)